MTRKKSICMGKALEDSSERIMQLAHPGLLRGTASFSFSGATTFMPVQRGFILLSIFKFEIYFQNKIDQ